MTYAQAGDLVAGMRGIPVADVATDPSRRRQVPGEGKLRADGYVAPGPTRSTMCSVSIAWLPAT
jgi:hypothetical protein